jgi:hypothetical protein
VAKLASQSAGLFEALSVRTETRPRPLNKLARQLARAGELRANQRSPQDVHGSSLHHVARMVWSMTSPEASKVALIEAMAECMIAIRAMLDATDRARTAATMLTETKKALTEVHMRANGVDPTRPYTRAEGSPPWAAAVRAAVVVEGGDLVEAEQFIADRADGWKARRIAEMGFPRPGQPIYDERGQLTEITPNRASNAVPKPQQQPHRPPPPPSHRRDRDRGSTADPGSISTCPNSAKAARAVIETAPGSGGFR